MTVSGDRSSCEALATKSRRIFVNRTRSAEDGCGTLRFGAAVTGGLAVHCACTKTYDAAGTLAALRLACNDTAATTGVLAKGDVLRATAAAVV